MMPNRLKHRSVLGYVGAFKGQPVRERTADDKSESILFDAVEVITVYLDEAEAKKRHRNVKMVTIIWE